MARLGLDAAELEVNLPYGGGIADESRFRLPLGHANLEWGWRL